MPKQPPQTPSQIIREAREILRMTQYELAEKVGVKPGAIYRWEHGDFPSDMICRLADALEIPVESLRSVTT